KAPKMRQEMRNRILLAHLGVLGASILCQIHLKPAKRLSLNETKRFQPDVKMRVAVDQDQLAVIRSGVVETLAVAPRDELVAFAVDQKHRHAGLGDRAKGRGVVGI